VLNPGFSAEADRLHGSTYILPTELAGEIVDSNSDFATGPELRRQRVYGDELWGRLDALGLGHVPWSRLDVLDACCGTGFLSYHLLQRSAPRSLTLLDVSPIEVEAARTLVAGMAPGIDLEVRCADLAESEAIGAFDVVIGNSFLHHFPDVPQTLATVRHLVRPGGRLVGLHEPAVGALAWEAGGVRAPLGLLFARERWVRRMRYAGDGSVRPGTTDVWIFAADDLRGLLERAGFVDVVVEPRYLIRPYVVALLGLHLRPGRERLSRVEQVLLRTSLRIDAALREVLPERVFGGLSFSARRPETP
jgi:SAM-dependent methyltransferase